MTQLGQHMLTKGLLKEQELLTTLEMSLRKLKKSTIATSVINIQ